MRVSGNAVTNSGGGIENNNGTLMRYSSTLSGNTANNGGGILNYQGTLAVTNATLSANFATNNGGGIYNNGGALALANSIVAGNSSFSGTNISGSFSGTNNLTNGVPLLAPLGNYGGPTQTMPPLAGSPAIDAGDDSVTSYLAADQRGYPRLSGAHVDIGAAEAQLAPSNNRPLLTNPTVQAGGVAGGVLSFSFTNVPDADFTVLASSNIDLPLGQWTLLGQMTQASPGQYQFSDPDATNYPMRFYQVVSP